MGGAQRLDEVGRHVELVRTALVFPVAGALEKGAWAGRDRSRRPPKSTTQRYTEGSQRYTEEMGVQTSSPAFLCDSSVNLRVKLLAFQVNRALPVDATQGENANGRLVLQRADVPRAAQHARLLRSPHQRLEQRPRLVNRLLSLRFGGEIVLPKGV